MVSRFGAAVVRQRHEDRHEWSALVAKQHLVIAEPTQHLVLAHDGLQTLRAVVLGGGQAVGEKANGLENVLVARRLCGQLP